MPLFLISPGQKSVMSMLVPVLVLMHIQFPVSALTRWRATLELLSLSFHGVRPLAIRLSDWTRYRLVSSDLRLSSQPDH
jgi:hypothetical protein